MTVSEQVEARERRHAELNARLTAAAERLLEARNCNATADCPSEEGHLVVCPKRVTAGSQTGHQRGQKRQQTTKEKSAAEPNDHS